MRILAASLLFLACAVPAGGAAAAPERPASAETPRAKKADRGAGPRQAHGHVPTRQVGKASIYARKFANRKMANGERMDPHGDNAASKTLPLGTRAQVTNLETGKSAMVTIEDRGPYVQGRIVDLSPATAAQIGLTHEQGIAPVEVRPIEVPPPRDNG